MASQNQANKFISTKRTLKVNIGNAQNPQARIETQKIKINNSVTLPECSSNLAQLNGSTTQSSTSQNYSSRNSLRAAQSAAVNSVHPESESYHSKMPNLFRETPQIMRGVEGSDSYDILRDDFSIRLIGDFLYCMLCGRRERINGSDTAFEKHLSTDYHQRQFLSLKNTLLNRAPDSSSLEMLSIRELLDNWHRSQSLTSERMKLRLDAIGEFHKVLEEVDHQVKCDIIGSFATGTSLIYSDVNLELIHPNSSLFEKDPRAKNSTHHQLVDPNAEYGQQFNKHTIFYDLIPNPISCLHVIMEKLNNNYRIPPMSSFEVVSGFDDLNAKVPRLVLRHLQTSTILSVCCYPGAAKKLSILINAYLSIDSRARTLSLIVKHWAKICKINNPENGTYPPDTFIILVIYYLQRVEPPVLPCLHEMLSKGSKSDPANKATDSLTTDMDKLDLDQPKGDERVEQLDDELDDEEEEDGLCTEINENIVNREGFNWKSSNSCQVHELFLDFLQFMISEFKDISNVITIRTLRRVQLKDKRWDGKAIENPVQPRNNISRCVGSIRIYDYIRDCFELAYYYLTSVPLTYSYESDRLIPKNNRIDATNHSVLYLNHRRFDSYFSMKERSIGKSCKYDPISEMIRQNIFSRNVEVINALFDSFELELLPKQVARWYNEALLIPPDSICTEFCWLCRQSGHSKPLCPKGKLINLQAESESYDFNLDIKANLDSDLYRLYKRDSIHPALARKHLKILHILTNIINSSTDLNCRLQLFGSTVNNLGSYDSDLDICMTLDGNKTGKGVDCVQNLQTVCEVLEKVQEVNYIEPILEARVPIIKFKYELDNRLECDVDLSMYNDCAVHNSKLLRAYSEIDSRVAILFYLVKRYAKGCGIADASKGSLSSYAWSLLVIHYLQQINPPILPVLQEPKDMSKAKLIGINGWNVWFDIEATGRSTNPNDLSITALFKGFFLYYGNFPFNFYVVSIRKKSYITRFQKSWHNRMMCIEDPFELTYNLASRLDEPMAIYIINSFAQAYRHLVKTQEFYLKAQNPHGESMLIKRLFDGREITNSNPPYRGCRVCHRIGHKLKDCPERAKTRNRPNNGARNRFSVAVRATA